MKAWAQARSVLVAAELVALFALAVVASRVADKSTFWAAALIAAILIGVLAWEIVLVIRARGTTDDVVRTWLHSHWRSLIVLGALALGLAVVMVLSTALD